MPSFVLLLLLLSSWCNSSKIWIILPMSSLLGFPHSSYVSLLQSNKRHWSTQYCCAVHCVVYVPYKWAICAIHRELIKWARKHASIHAAALTHDHANLLYQWNSNPLACTNTSAESLLWQAWLTPEHVLHLIPVSPTQEVASSLVLTNY